MNAAVPHAVGVTSPECTPASWSRLRDDLIRIAERFEFAEQREHRAHVLGEQDDRDAAEVERHEAAGEFFAASRDLADLLLFLLRKALEYRPHELMAYLRDALSPELETLAEAIVHLEDLL